MKGQKGITLVALIITIVVMLILAIVAVTSINETNIIGGAKDAQIKWNDAVTKENGRYDTLNTLLDQNR